MHRFATTLAFAACLAIAAPAGADHGPRILRTGPTAGGGVGAGNMFSSCDDEFECGSVLEAASVHLFAGGFLMSDTALVVEGWGTAHRDDQVTITNGLVVVAAQQWLAPRFWLKGGIGAARSSFEYDGLILDVEDRSEIAPGLLLATGFDVVEGQRSAFDIQLRYGAGLFSDPEARVHTLALAAGLSFH